MSQEAYRKVSRKELENRIDSGAKASDAARLEGMQGMMQLKQKKARLLQNERGRLRKKYDRKHQRVQQVETGLNAAVDGVAALNMEIARSKTPVTKPDVMKWVVHGHVYDRGGKPIENADVTVVGMPSGKTVETVNKVKTDKRGYYKISYQATASEVKQPQEPELTREQILKQAGESTLGQASEEKTEPQGSKQPATAYAEQTTGQTDDLKQQRLIGGLRINSEANIKSAVYVRASLTDSPEIYADSSAMLPQAGNCNYRDIILPVNQDDDSKHVCDPLRVTRYLGNSSSRELHDLKNEKRQCRINKIRFDNAVNFKSIKQAEKSGYDFCAYCFSREMSKH